eukprot:TRINITY_DN41132_c0_g1_i1.p1 TRINITY_DN41132_c0_g1~~TRINITY_DN41132_c0_g1_i1.p1  ORF type:complete len:271 (+),score=92.65 TRINITY_DN41132_c0_g1_i1:1-813(+)
MTEQQLDYALDLMRRLPPKDIEDNLAGLIDLCPDLIDDLLSSVDQPLKVATCKKTGKDYLLCDYNRDGDSYRSPWSNEYDPPVEDGAVPSDDLRSLEVRANDVFDIYRSLYYEGGVSSVYTWDTDEGFAAVILIKKSSGVGKKNTLEGVWDSIHVLDVTDSGTKATYKLTSTIMLSMVDTNSSVGKFNLAGSLTRQAESELSVDASNTHIANMGRMIEDMEFKLRNSLDQIYFGKTRDITNQLRVAAGVKTMNAQRNAQHAIMADLKGKQ